MATQQEQETQAKQVKNLGRMVGIYQQRLADEQAGNIALTIDLENLQEELDQLRGMFKAAAQELSDVRVEVDSLKGASGEKTNKPAKG